MTSVRGPIVVAVNPAASFGANRSVGARVVERLRFSGHDVIGVAAADVDALGVRVVSALRGARALVVVGGDGMVSFGTNLVAGSGIPLGVVPTGTGNDFARGVGIPHDDPDAATGRLLDALGREPRRIDAGRVRSGTGEDGVTTWFAGAVSAGFDAAVNERANAMSRPRGRQRYTVALLRELVTLKPKRYRVEVDGVRSCIDALLISVANNGTIGGGMRIVPTADLADGLLDLFVVSPLTRIGFLRLFPKVFAGTHVALRQVSMTRVSSVRIDCDAPVTAYADGERIGPLPLLIDVVPGALRILAS